MLSIISCTQSKAKTSIAFMSTIPGRNLNYVPLPQVFHVSNLILAPSTWPKVVLTMAVDFFLLFVYRLKTASLQAEIAQT